MMPHGIFIHSKVSRRRQPGTAFFGVRHAAFPQQEQPILLHHVLSPAWSGRLPPTPRSRSSNICPNLAKYGAAQALKSEAVSSNL